jgi:uncharacterized protein
MNSSLYQCNIFHKRIKPVERQFSYSVFMMSLDLDELDQLVKKHWLFSRNHWNIYSIHDSDYFEKGTNQTIKQNLLDYLATQNFDITNVSRCILQTFPRIFGYQFNPVSFFYIEDSSGTVIATVAEVGNTFLEKKMFLVGQKDKRGWFKLKTPKNFYVSPFSKVNDSFDFQIGPKNKKWAININDEDADGIVLVSTIRGNQKEFTSLRLSWYIIRYPLLTLRVIILIHWHALLMWIRKFPISNKSGTAADQTNVLRPHQSLTKK